MSFLFGFAPFKSKLVSIGIIVAVIQVFLLINADFIYGEFVNQVRFVLTLYFFLYLIMVSPLGKKLPTFTQGPQAIQNFIIGFIITAAVMTVIPLFLVKASSLEFVTLSLGFGLLHGFVKAYIEEIVFRYALPIAFGFGDIISSILFASFHISVIVLSGAAGLGFDMVFRFILLFALGMIWSFTRNRLGILASVGSHFSYNLFVLGAIPSFFGVGI